MAFFRYPGGKAKLRLEIVSRLKACLKRTIQYREPFFGGGSIGLHLFEESRHGQQALFADQILRDAWINDKDIGIATLWTAVYRHPKEFVSRIQEFRPSVQAFETYKSELVSLTQMPTDAARIIDIGFKKLAVHQISYSGLGTKSGGPLGGVSQESAYKIDCRWSPNYLCKQVNLIHFYLNHLNLHNGGCTNLDYSALIHDISVKSLLYLDPPYYIKGNHLYQHGFSQEDHKRLALSLKSTEHLWILSYDDCQEIRDLYKWWAMILRIDDVNYSITSVKTTGPKRLTRNKPELLIYSFLTAATLGRTFGITRPV